MQTMKLKRPLPGYEVGDRVHVEERDLDFASLTIFSLGGGRTIAYIPVDFKDEWLEPDEPKRWRAQTNELYFFIDDGLRIIADHEGDSIMDGLRADCGNYFCTIKQAEDAALKVKELLLSIAEKV